MRYRGVIAAVFLGALVGQLGRLGQLQGAPPPQAADETLTLRPPWPRVLPCSHFDAAAIQLMRAAPGSRPGSGSWAASGRLERLRWVGDDGAQLSLEVPPQDAPGGKPTPVRMARPFAMGVPFRLSLLDARPSELPELKIVLHCAGQPAAGVRFVCKTGQPCDVSAAYPCASRPRERHTMAALSCGARPSEGESCARPRLLDRLLRRRTGPVPSKELKELPAVASALGQSTRDWLKGACAGGRCSAPVEAARAYLEELLAAGPLRVTQARAEHDANECGEQYRLSFLAQAGARTLQVQCNDTSFEDPIGCRLFFGAPTARLDCDVDGPCSLIQPQDEGTLDGRRNGSHADDWPEQAACGRPLLIERSALAIGPGL